MVEQLWKAEAQTPIVVSHYLPYILPKVGNATATSVNKETVSLKPFKAPVGRTICEPPAAFLASFDVKIIDADALEVS